MGDLKQGVQIIELTLCSEIIDTLTFTHLRKLLGSESRYKNILLTLSLKESVWRYLLMMVGVAFSITSQTVAWSL